MRALVSPGHPRAWCHIAAGLALVLLAGCAARSGWERTSQRACRPADHPRLCVVAEPDRQLVVRAGGEALVPGECAVAPTRRGGPLRVTAEDGRSGASRAKTLRVRRGATTTIGARADARPVVLARERCDGRVDEDMSEATGR